jgi:hypothetical protein
MLRERAHCQVMQVIQRKKIRQDREIRRRKGSGD